MSPLRSKLNLPRDAVLDAARSQVLEDRRAGAVRARDRGEHELGCLCGFERAVLRRARCAGLAHEAHAGACQSQGGARYVGGGDVEAASGGLRRVETEAGHQRRVRPEARAQRQSATARLPDRR
jgi:hypothetical protein